MAGLGIKQVNNHDPSPPSGIYKDRDHKKAMPVLSNASSIANQSGLMHKRLIEKKQSVRLSEPMGVASCVCHILFSPKLLLGGCWKQESLSLLLPGDLTAYCHSFSVQLQPVRLLHANDCEQIQTN